MAAAELSVVVSTLDSPSTLARVLDALERQTVAPAEVLVAIDAAAPDREATLAAIGERPYPLGLAEPTLPGAAANRNAGLRAARSELVLFCDDDAVPDPPVVAEHLAWHERHPGPEVAVLGHVRWADGIRVTPFMRWLDQGVLFDYGRIEGIEAGWGRFYTANVSLRRAFVARVGGFDEERFPYPYEDVEFAYRADRLGLRLLYNRDAVAQHLRAYDLADYERRVRGIARAERQFVRVHPELRPWFYDLYSEAARAAPASGRGRHLIGRIPRSTPLLGERAWASADLYYRQRLAPAFLAAWEEAGEDD